MKSREKKLRLMLIAIAITFVFQACLKDRFENIEDGTDEGIITDSTAQASIYNGFDFKTVTEYEVVVLTLNNLKLPLKGVYVELYTKRPLSSLETLNPDAKDYLLIKGITNKDGILQCKINPPSLVDSLYILTSYIGLPSLHSVFLNKSQIEVVIGGQDYLKSSTNSGINTSLKSLAVPVPTQVNGYYTLGDWNHYGVPDYLESTDDEITNSLLDDINTSLPERSPLPETHPQYLASSDDANLVLNEDCEIWVTFVHEGAGWHNSLGYYTYPTNSPPLSVDDINDLTIIFPDVSNYYNGLTPGNKVQLYYLNPETNQYSSTFPSGVSVGWFLIAQGWSSNDKHVTNGKYIHYSNINLNVEADADLQKHNVLLFDEARDLLLLGFEDIRRDHNGCDQDFNDAVFYATLNPISAVTKSAYQKVDTPTDSDGDGANDDVDQFPYDASNSFNNYYPSENTFGTLVFEDMWPSKGDYDFNDLVVDYNFNQVTNAQNKVVALRIKTKVKAIGASYHNAFAISLNTSPGNITSVTGQNISKGYLNISGNGTENGQSKAVIIFFDDAYNVLPYPGTGVCVNTFPQYPFVTPTVQEIDIVFSTPIDFSEIGTPPYNPFIIVDRIRGKEIHLPNLPPTDLANFELFGTQDDDSDISADEFYVSDIYLPWAINLPESFSYPKEKEGIVHTHLKFNGWAVSRGYNYMDWYQNKTGYRDNGKIYAR